MFLISKQVTKINLYTTGSLLPVATSRLKVKMKHLDFQIKRVFRSNPKMCRIWISSYPWVSLNDCVGTWWSTVFLSIKNKNQTMCCIFIFPSLEGYAAYCQIRSRQERKSLCLPSKVHFKEKKKYIIYRNYSHAAHCVEIRINMKL